MVAKTKSESNGSIDLKPIQVGHIEVHVLGLTPYIANRLSEKAERQLLLPGGKKTAKEKQTTLKHVPLDEYRASPYMLADGPTLLAIPAGAFKGALMSAALDVGGITKAQIGRLTWIEGFNIPVYGIPQVRCDIVRSSDIARTPDVRTRACLQHWAATFTVSFVEPNLRAQHIGDLLNAAGLIAGVGDWRQQKGSASFGQFQVVQPNDPRFLSVVKNGGRAAQKAAMKSPEPLDAQTEELLAWYDVEVKQRGFRPVNETALEEEDDAVPLAEPALKAVRGKRGNAASTRTPRS